MEKFRVVNTDNFGGDYPNESFVCPPLSKPLCEMIATELNGPEAGWNYMSQYYKVVPDGYKLQPGFEPWPD